ncbi:T-cell surface glycoprotein CD1a-like isoform X4 [Marmota flaviventris]|uniref:T-cell surface glycoprotein CD1a-like isoform X4 n=1 Tax=Marmota flaviventris TaxID=93162 RepID=UPI003A846422
MLFLLLPLLTALFQGGDSGFEESISYHLMQTSSFHNHSWVHVGSGWLGELQTHRWNSSSNTIIYLYPWSRGNFSNKELMDVERLFQLYFNEHQDFYISQLMFKGLCFTNSPQRQPAATLPNLQSDPFDLQVTVGCELHSGKGFLGFKQVAIQGHDFMSFQNETFLPSPKGGEKAQKACKLLNFNEAYTQRLYRLLSDTCPRFTLGLLDAGKAHLQQLDGTWYLRATLDVAAGEAAGLACRVKHSSLGGQDLVLHWGAPQSALGLILFAVIVALALLTGLGFWFRKRWTHCEAP